jgi:hypothetical protein
VARAAWAGQRAARPAGVARKAEHGLRGPVPRAHALLNRPAAREAYSALIFSLKLTFYSSDLLSRRRKGSKRDSVMFKRPSSLGPVVDGLVGCLTWLPCTQLDSYPSMTWDDVSRLLAYLPFVEVDVFLCSSRSESLFLCTVSCPWSFCFDFPKRPAPALVHASAFSSFDAFRLPFGFSNCRS